MLPFGYARAVLRFLQGSSAPLGFFPVSLESWVSFMVQPTPLGFLSGFTRILDSLESCAGCSLKWFGFLWLTLSQFAGLLRILAASARSKFRNLVLQSKEGAKQRLTFGAVFVPAQRGVQALQASFIEPDDSLLYAALFSD